MCPESTVLLQVVAMRVDVGLMSPMDEDSEYFRLSASGDGSEGGVRRAVDFLLTPAVSVILPSSRLNMRMS